MMNKKTFDTHSEELQKLKDLLFSEATSKIITGIQNISHLEHHIFAASYNWNSGFEIPESILGNRIATDYIGISVVLRRWELTA